MSEDKKFWLLEYQIISEKLERFFGIYLRVFAIFIAITGGLMKFSLDGSATDDLRNTLGIYGILVCALLYACIIMTFAMTKRMRKRRNYALEKIGEMTEDEFVAINWTGSVFLIFNTLTVIGWVYILSNA